MGAFALCSSLSLGSTYYSLKGVTLTTLSLGRLDCVLEEYCRQNLNLKNLKISSISNRGGGVDGVGTVIVRGGERDGERGGENINKTSTNTSTNTILTPYQVRKREEYLGPQTSLLVEPVVGADLDRAIRTKNELQGLLGIYSKEEYLLNAYTSVGPDLAPVGLVGNVETGHVSSSNGDSDGKKQGKVRTHAMRI